ncbi:UNVERIFIED_CONTAM: hypothetical protein FKN15_007530 [Acipenser sinensis]
MTTNIMYGIFPALEVGNTELSISELPKAPSCDDALGPAFRGYKTVTHWKISLFFLLKTVRRRHMLMGDCPGCGTEDRDFVELGRCCLPAPGDSSGD